MAATPPPRSRISTPLTPLHGAKYDHSQTSLRSTRSSRRASQGLQAARTPSPDRSLLHSKRNSGSKRPSTTFTSTTFSPPSSAQASPRKRKRDSAMDVTDDGDALNSPKGRSYLASQPKMNASLAVAALPTPVKTPRKQKQQSEAQTLAARVLFPSTLDSSIEPKYAPASLGRRRTGRRVMFNDEDELGMASNIEIYVDSDKRVPEPVEDEDNPFYVKSGGSAKSSVKSSRKHGGDPNRNEDVKEALRNDEGMIYVFRGKKIYKRFDEDDNNSADELGEMPTLAHFSSTLEHTPQHFTRSSIKPRLLFPAATRNADSHLTDEEEAETDIEDPLSHDPELDATVEAVEDDVGMDSSLDELTTPTKLHYPAFTSPPTTARVNRSSKRTHAEISSPDTPGAPDSPSSLHKRYKRHSPLDHWARTKPGEGRVVKRRAVATVKRGSA